MSVTVSSITSSTTSTNTADWGGHNHSIPQEDCEVPDSEEFDELSATCDKLSRAIKRIEQKVDLLVKKIEVDKKEQKAHLTKELALYDRRHNELRKIFQAQLSAGSPFFTAFTKMTQAHVKNIQKMLDKIQKETKKNKKKNEELPALKAAQKMKDGTRTRPCVTVRDEKAGFRSNKHGAKK